MRISFTSGERGKYIADLKLLTKDNQKANLTIVGKSNIEKANISLNKLLYNAYANVNETSSFDILIKNNSNSTEFFNNNIMLSDSNFKIVSPINSYKIDGNSIQKIVVEFNPKFKGNVNCVGKIPIDLAEDSLEFNIIGSTDFDNIDLINDKSFNYTIFPNPISNTTTIKFYGLNSSFSQFKIFNCQGEIVKRFDLNDNCSIQWDCKNDNSNYVSSGIYYGVLQYGTESKVLLLNLIR